MPLSISTNSNATNLASNLLGPGITMVAGSASYSGPSAAVGLFSGGNSVGLGIDSGVILTTGQASTAIGPNNLPSAGTQSGGAGDARLTQLAGVTTADASVLGFNFTSNGGSLFFKFVFASDEYTEFVDQSYNDVFAFYLDGVNIALIPGTNTPVSINNVNDHDNSSLYRNNPVNSGAINIQYDGLTTVITVSALNLSAGNHRIDLAIADAGDQKVDSAVFIAAGSFTDTNPSNHNPVANPDSITTPQNTPVDIFVLNNDSDPDGNSLSITAASGASHGTATISGSKIVYTPASGYAGTDTFTYTISDGHQGSASTTVTVSVAGLLFTEQNDTVNFNALTPGQAASVTPSADLYHALNGDDIVTIPDANHLQLTSSVRWDSSRIFDGGGGKDVIHLVGSPGDYTVTVTYGTTWETTTTRLVASKPNETPIITTSVEQAKFQDPINNTVHLINNNLVAEMARLSLEVYGNYTSAHQQGGADRPNPHSIDPLAWQSLFDPTVPNLATGRGWHPLSAIELGMMPRDYPGDSYDPQWSFTNGYYMAFGIAPTVGAERAEGLAFAMTGLVNGKKVLVVSFAGTDQTADMLTYGQFATHYALFKPLVDALKTYVAAGNVDEVLLTGHSLGAGMVQLMLRDSEGPANVGGVGVEAFTFGSPGADISLSFSDNRIVNFLHTNDLVAFAGSGIGSTVETVLSSFLTAAEIALGTLAAQQLGPVGFAEYLHQLDLTGEGGLSNLALPKVRVGSEVKIDSDVLDTAEIIQVTKNKVTGGGPTLGDVVFNEHSMSLYTRDMIKLVDFANDAGSPFRTTALAQSLVAGTVYTGPTLQIGVGQPAKSPLNLSDSLGVGYNTTIRPPLVSDDFVLASNTDDRILLDYGHLVASGSSTGKRIFDGAAGDADTLFLPGSPTWYQKVANGSGYDISYFNPDDPNAVTPVYVGTFYRVELIQYSNGGPLRFDGAALNAQTPTPGATTFNIASSLADAGDVDNLNVIGRAAADNLTFGHGHKTINLGDGDDFATSKYAAAGAVAQFSVESGSFSALAAAASPTADDVTINGEGGDDFIVAGAGNDTLLGGTGDDSLNGGSGIDSMSGGVGDDRYYVDNVLDAVTENLNEGTDIVEASVTFTLAANLENLTLAENAGAINGTGNDGNNTILGNKSSNVIDGEAGADIMAGGLGNDTYFVDNVGDLVAENAGQGADLVYALVDFTLTAEVENLTLLSAAGSSGSIDLTESAVSLSRTSLVQGNSITVTHTLGNPAAGISGAGTVGYYLSTDATITTSDTFLGLSSFGTILPNSSTSLINTIILPANLTNGTYYIGVIADYTNAIAETNNNNNASSGVAITVTTAPTAPVDLTTEFFLPNVLSKNGITVSYRITNSGTQVGSAGDVGIFLSTDSVITTSDMLLTFSNLTNPIAAGGLGSSGNFAVPLPSLAPGTYYLGAIADYNNTVPETNNANNASAGVAFTANIPVTAPVDPLNGTGNALGNTIVGNARNNTLAGLDGNDFLNGGAGNDLLIGGTGTDTAVYNAASSAYKLLSYGGAVYVLTSGSDGIDQLQGVENIQFTNLTVSASTAATFDPWEYLASNSDLIQAIGANPQAGFNHYIGSGYLEGRPTTSFDPIEYVASNSDLISAIGLNPLAAEQHYVMSGFNEHRPTNSFDALEYLASNGDLALGLGLDLPGARAHYVSNGFKEGRPTASFDPLEYLASNVDLLRAFGLNTSAAAQHYVTNGFREHRPTTSFDPIEYLASNPDLIRAMGLNSAAALQHFLHQGYLEGRPTASFNALDYLASNPDLIRFMGLDPAAAYQHFLHYGYNEGRPTASFDALEYLASNPDLIPALGLDTVSAEQHYISAGLNEHRATNSFDPAEYLASNTDLIPVFGYNPSAAFQHFLHNGYADGRPTASFDPLEYLASNPDLIPVFGVNVAAARQHYIQAGFSQHRPTTSFDSLEYLASNPDLIRALGLNAAAALQHFLHQGYLEGRPTASFNALDYLASNPDLIRFMGLDTAAAYQHFLHYGYNEGRPTASFDALEYLASNPDLIRAFGLSTVAAEQHYIAVGLNEHRATNSFDPLEYLASNPDLIGAFGYNPGAAFQHFLHFGYAEGRATASFDPFEYLASNTDLISAIGYNPVGARQHYVQSGFNEHRGTTSFDPLEYLASNPDLIRAFGLNTLAAEQHYVLTGFNEHRPVTSFDPLEYLASNPDLIHFYGLDPAAAYQHYLHYGAYEGRSTATFNAAQYLANNPDLTAAFGANNLVAAEQHYITNGLNDGRTDQRPVINGDAGNNNLIAKHGAIMTGGAGADNFVFSQPPQTSIIVTDFAVGADHLQISASGFGHGLTAGGTPALVSAATASAATHAGTGGYFIFDNAGTVWWDQTGGSGSDAIALARLTGIAALHANDFLLA